MNYPKEIQDLIAACEVIDEKCKLRLSRHKRYMEIARQLKKLDRESQEYRKLKFEFDNLTTTVVDFGDCLANMQNALKKIKNKRN